VRAVQDQEQLAGNLGRFGAGTLRMRAGTAVVIAASFGCIRTSLAAVLLSRGSWAGTLGMCATILGGFGHNGVPFGFLSRFTAILSMRVPVLASAILMGLALSNLG
jgi:hypothetical protein